LERRTKYPCWRCRPHADPTLVHFEGCYEDFVAARDHAAAAGVCVDVGIALSLELQRALSAGAPSGVQAASVPAALRRIAAGHVQLAGDASMRSWQRYLIAGTDEKALDQLPDVALPRSVAEGITRPPALHDFLSVPVSTITLAGRCEVVAAGRGITLVELVRSHFDSSGG
jgi:hypothetical protein